jgi:hypothetical protein
MEDELNEGMYVHNERDRKAKDDFGHLFDSILTVARTGNDRSYREWADLAPKVQFMFAQMIAAPVGRAGAAFDTLTSLVGWCGTADAAEMAEVF